MYIEVSIKDFSIHNLRGAFQPYIKVEIIWYLFDLFLTSEV